MGVNPNCATTIQPGIDRELDVGIGVDANHQCIRPERAGIQGPDDNGADSLNISRL